jgi:hypothetical protein
MGVGTLDFKVGDKIILIKESTTYSPRSGYTSNFSKEVLEVASIDSEVMYTVEKGYLYRNFRIDGLLEFRLATESEIKIDKIKSLFITNKYF